MKDKRPERVQKKLGKRIEELRKAKGVQQQELATKLNVSSAYLSEVENGKKAIGIKGLTRIAIALGVDVKDLIPF